MMDVVNTKIKDIEDLEKYKKSLKKNRKKYKFEN